MNTITRPDIANIEDAIAWRTCVRHVAMYLSIGITALYGLVASHIVTVVAGTAEQVARDQLGFALPDAAAYLLGAGLLWRFDRRLLGIAGAVLQVLCRSPIAR